MEEAKITQTEEDIDIKVPQQEFNLNSRWPSIITTDDLVFRIGKAQMEISNLEKLLTGVHGRLQGAEKALGEIQPKLIKAEEIRQSNKLYEENNRKLDAELSKIRRENNASLNEVIMWRGKAETQEAMKDALKDEVERLEDELETEKTAREAAEKKHKNLLARRNKKGE